MTDELATTPDHTSRGPSWLPGLLVVLATVLAVVTTMTTWVNSQALDTDQWVEASGDLLEEPEVTDALSVYLTNELFEAVDVTAELKSVLPENLSGLAGPLVGALQGRASDRAEQLISSDRFKSLWEQGNRLAHETIVAILRNDTRGNVTTADGSVVLDLSTAVSNVGEALGVPQAALDRIPPDVGQVTILTSTELADAQNAVRVLDFSSSFLFGVVVALYALAVYLAAGRRRRMLRSVGVGLMVGGLSLLAIRAVAIRASVDLFVKDSSNNALVQVVGSVLTELLRQMAWTGIVYGLLIIVVVELLGAHRWAVAVRRSVAGAADSTASLVGLTVATVLVLVWWSPGRAFERWVTALTLIALVVGAVVAVVVTGRRELQSADLPSHSKLTDSM